MTFSIKLLTCTSLTALALTLSGCVAPTPTIVQDQERGAEPPAAATPEAAEAPKTPEAPSTEGPDNLTGDNVTPIQ